MLIHRFGENAAAMDDPRLRRAMREAVDELDTSITRICEYEEIANGVVLPDISTMEIDAAIGERVADARRRAADLGLTFSAQPSSPALLAAADAKLTARIIGAALENAIDFTPAGSIRLETEELDDRVIIRVTDDGVGIEEGAQPYLFQPFFAANLGAARRDRRLGLGLAYAQKAAALMGAELGLSPRDEANGACFHLRLPRSVS